MKAVDTTSVDIARNQGERTSESAPSAMRPMTDEPFRSARDKEAFFSPSFISVANATWHPKDWNKIGKPLQCIRHHQEPKCFILHPLPSLFRTSTPSWGPDPGFGKTRLDKGNDGQKESNEREREDAKGLEGSICAQKRGK
jgi:hypothetical protein